MRASILCIALSFCLIPVLSLNVWPLPKQFTTGTNVVNVAEDGFTFQCKYSNGGACSQVLTDAFKRYEQYIFFNQEDIIPSEFPPEAPSLMTLNIVVNQANVALTMGVDESYDLSVSTSGNKATATLNAPNDWAALRGLETFSQLVELNLQTGGYQINGVPVSISDAPRFVHRGLLIDSSRHYLAIKDVLRVLDAMSFNKLNVLHWHIVDSQSFPLESTTFPLLSEKGAYFYTAVYSHDQVSQVLDYAWQRGIRVIPEFDMPGHSQSWGKGYPEIMTKCQISSPLSDVMNPIHETTYDFLTAFLKEMAGLFDEPFVHLGGDEVDPSCWENNTEIVNWMKQQGMTEPIELQGYFEEKIEVIAAGIGKTTILWEECFDYGFDLNDDTIINVWMNPQELINVIKAGRRAIQSGGYYLDRQVPTGEIHYFWMDTWQDFYNSDPLGDFYNLTDTEVSLVLGGEASMWGEQVDGDSIDIRVWPRASATAERLWSPREVNSTEEAQPRLINFRCDLTRRGIRASPIGSDFCYRGF